MGIPVGSKYVVWAELLLIQLLTPNASFVGHLAGILVGLFYIYGPLKKIMDVINGMCSFCSWFSDILTKFSVLGIFRYLTSESRPNDDGHRLGSSRSSNNYRYAYSQNDYAPDGMPEEEQIRRSMEESLRNTRSTRSSRNSHYPDLSGFSQNPSAPPYPTDTPVYSPYPDAETLRRLRTQRYANQ